VHDSYDRFKKFLENVFHRARTKFVITADPLENGNNIDCYNSNAIIAIFLIVLPSFHNFSIPRETILLFSRLSRSRL